VSERRDGTPQNLMNAFMRFKKLHWHHSPVNGLNHSDIGVLLCLLKNSKPDTEGMKVSEISGFLRVKPPTVTQIINQLDSKGLVQRTVDSKDRRVVRIKLTKKGVDTVETAHESFYSLFEELVDFLGEDQSKTLTFLINQVFLFFSQSQEKEM